MKLAVMQPYFFPYLGYYQLVSAVDMFAFYDDVNYIKNGWINRNRVLMNGEPRYITVPLHGASPNRKILEIDIDSHGKWKTVMMKTIMHAYSKAPFKQEILPVISEVIDCPPTSIAEMAMNSVTRICDYLGIHGNFIETSRKFANAHLSGQERIIDICKTANATTYINPMGGISLYSSTDFTAEQIELLFIQPGDIRYTQRCKEFVPWLSIIDVLMNTGKDGTNELIGEYSLVAQ